MLIFCFYDFYDSILSCYSRYVRLISVSIHVMYNSLFFFILLMQWTHIWYSNNALIISIVYFLFIKVILQSVMQVPQLLNFSKNKIHQINWKTLFLFVMRTPNSIVHVKIFDWNITLTTIGKLYANIQGLKIKLPTILTILTVL